MNKLKKIILFCLLISSNNSFTAEVEIGGLLLDNTISRLGHEFSHQFSMLWQDMPNTNGINVQIIEQLVPRAGTRLLINLNNKTIYVTHMGRRQESMKARVEQAIFILINAIAQAENEQLNPDMVGEGW